MRHDTGCSSSQYFASTYPSRFQNGPVQALYGSYPGKRYNAITKPEWFFSNGLIGLRLWPITVPIPFASTGPVIRQCAEWYWARKEYLYETIISAGTGPLPVPYQIVCWVDPD